MEHFRLRKYRGPETWARVREAYVAGEPGPSVALRFDVGLANIRKKAAREGWTRRHVAEAIDLRRIRGEPDAAPPPWETVEPAPPLALFAPEPAAPEPPAPEPVAPAVAVAKGLARASAALARGDAAGAVALTRAAEGLAKATGQDPAAPPPPEVLDDDADAAREAEARDRWEGLHRLIEERAEILAGQMMQDRACAPAVHGGLVFHWRALNLGPEAAAVDLDAGRNGGWADSYWREDGTLQPLEHIRANTAGTFRQIIRREAGLPLKGSPWGEKPVWE